MTAPTPAAASRATASPAAPATTARRRWAILAICASALFLVGLDTTIVTVGLPSIGAGLRMRDGALAWVIDAYTVPFASLLMTSGALADRYGRRRIFLTGLAVFGLASFVCEVVQSPAELIAARAAQGVGASMLTPVALSIVVNVMTDPVERARAIGVWGSVFGVSMAAGPVVGGALIGAFDWRAVFWINVPVVLVALVLVVAVVPESRGQRARPLDIPGQALLMLLIACGVALLIEGPKEGWGSPLTWGLSGGFLVLLIAFIVVEQRTEQPLVELSLFRIPSFAGAVLGAIAVFIAFSVTLLATTLVLQNGLGWSPLAAGAASLPMALASTVCAPFSGYLVGRGGARLPLAVAAAGVLVAGVLFLGIVWGLAPIWWIPAYISAGIGVGFANAPITNTAVNGLAPERAGVASGTASTARQLGTAIGIALAGGFVAGADAADVRAASLPAWLVVIACALVLGAVALTAPRSATRAPARPRRRGARSTAG